MENQENSTSEAVLDSMGEIELEIASLESRINSIQKKKSIYGLLAIMIFIAIAFIFLGPSILEESRLSTIAKQAPLIGLVIIAYALFGGFYFSIMRSSRISSLQRDLDMLKAKRRIISRSSTEEFEKKVYRILTDLLKSILPTLKPITA